MRKQEGGDVGTKAEISSALKWQVVLLVVLLLAIAFYFVIWMSKIPSFHEVRAKDIPLIVAIVVCGIPLVLQILLKLVNWHAKMTPL